MDKRILDKECMEHWQIPRPLWFAVIRSNSVVGMLGEKGQGRQVVLRSNKWYLLHRNSERSPWML